MAVHPSTPRAAIHLRETAEARLRERTAPADLGWTTGGDALACLHKLASNQESAADALRFLHELQVFQVEVDLQHEQLEQSRAELADQFSLYFELFERVAVGLLILDADGTIVVANPRAAALLGVDDESMSGRRLDGYVSVASRSALAAALRDLRGGTDECRCEVRSATADAAGDRLCLIATRSRDGKARMVVLTVAMAR